MHVCARPLVSLLLKRPSEIFKRLLEYSEVRNPRKKSDPMCVNLRSGSVVFIFFAMQLSSYSTLICVVVSMHMLESRASNSTTIIKSISKNS